MQSKNERRNLVDAVLAEALGTPREPRGTAIVYAPTRRSSDEECERLAGAGWRAACYHAGREASERDEVSTAFIEGNVDVVVATNAFGMGIDRADVRAVAHLAPPGSIEASPRGIRTSPSGRAIAPTIAPRGILMSRSFLPT